MTGIMFSIGILVLCVLGTQGTPTLSLGLPSFATFSAFGGRQDDTPGVKPFSGIRVKNDSLRMIYYHDQTVAIVELGPAKLLLNCELIEVYDPEDAIKLLHELSSVNKPLRIMFSEMLTLMGQCQQLESPLRSKLGSMSHHHQHHHQHHHETPISPMDRRQGKGLLSNNPFTIFSGIIPGTKWCGTGDIAVNYHDLGKEANMDKCCRSHDLCPIKIRAYGNRYNLTNDSLYTKSHCICDDNLFECLKKSDSPTAELMGNIYFNLVQVPCVMEGKSGEKRFRNARNNF